MGIVVVVVVVVVGIFVVVPERFSTWINSTRTRGKLGEKTSEFILFRQIILLFDFTVTHTNTHSSPTNRTADEV